jgi:hypothetical protein
MKAETVNKEFAKEVWDTPQIIQIKLGNTENGGSAHSDGTMDNS